MATFVTNQLENLRGKIGNYIIYRVKNQSRIRLVPGEYHDANTPEQQAVRRRLIACVRFYQRLRLTALHHAWVAAAKQGNAASGYSLYLKTNTGVFLADGSISDFSRLTLCPASGIMPADNMDVVRNTDGSVTITWENNAAKHSIRNTDRLVVAYLREDRAFTVQFLEPLPVCREDERATCLLAPAPGTATHLYCYFVSPKGDAYSENVYLKLSE